MQWGKPTKVARSRTSRLGDVRLWLGVCVLIGSMFIGARVMASGEETVTLWRATQDLAAGSQPHAVEPVVVVLGDSKNSYVQGVAQPSGTMLRPVGAGEFLPTGAVGAAKSEVIRVVAVPVNPLHVALDINPGDQVDVWATPDSSRVTPGSNIPLVPNRVLSKIRVNTIEREVVGTGGDIGVVLAVPESEVAQLVLAMRTGVIDIVKVPLAETTLPPAASDGEESTLSSSQAEW